MLIAVAGPYSAATSEERLRTLNAMNQAAAEVLQLGHVPVIGVNLALPVIQFLSDEQNHYAEMMRISLAIVDKCDAILLLGESPGVARERELVRAKGLPVYNSIADIPRVKTSS